MALLQTVGEPWLLKSRISSTAATLTSALASRSSGENSMVGACFSHKTGRMRRDDAYTGSPPEKRIKLEKVEEAISLSSSLSEHRQDEDLPPDFLEPLLSEERTVNAASVSATLQQSSISEATKFRKGTQAFSRQFWKAGDYEGDSAEKKPHRDGMDHVRVHPKFLHSNATSHKWALGAIAELLDNALDEVSNGATFVRIDTLNLKSTEGESGRVLVFEDNGGGMDPDCLRHCMSFGYSVKSKMTNTIGQYGNGFKTSTMRLGADVIVFSCSPAREGCVATRSIGLLSYSFLTKTRQQDIIVPMVDFEVQSYGLKKILRGQISDWNKNMETIKQWSPFSTERELLEQLSMIGQQGTRIIVSNLWLDDQEALELDFETDLHDIQLRGVNRDPKNIALAQHLPNSKHFLTYRHSLRSYLSILYLRLPSFFKIFLRGVEVRHHCLVDDMMMVENHTYRPLKSTLDERIRDDERIGQMEDASDMKAVVTLGFVKDAKEHADVQGFNVYHKNRLIKPFWRVWNAASSHGRGIIGVLEANFVEPAHDKQGFERTSVLAKLEARLVKMQKVYWSTHSHKIGYHNHHAKKKAKESSGGSTAKKALSNVGAQFSLLKAFPRSSRSRLPRVPSRRFCTETYSTQTGSAPVSEAPAAPSCSEVQAEGNLVSEDGCMSLEAQVQACNAAERVEWLKAQFQYTQQILEGTQKKLDEVMKERDVLKKELVEERRHAEVSDADLRKKLKETILRVKDLETENKRLKGS
ncbi:hypothetical protein GOP47_0014052 [Adiantum capillus-veneris]|uniref:Morc S5 domain-containing protein n=1 Tax=Adiantum capillus-veneris TaxID=13818 RepID=A0A9D4ZGD1_ADICA|nr:hypothetical protein GOP47_0014052 [Adiantum capillus-veneris]